MKHITIDTKRMLQNGKTVEQIKRFGCGVWLDAAAEIEGRTISNVCDYEARRGAALERRKIEEEQG